MLTLQDILTSNGKYPDRANSPECTQGVQDCAAALLDKVNSFLDELGWTGDTDVDSGFRTLESNEHTPNAATHSEHMLGKAVDLKDDAAQTLAKLVESRPDLLRKYGLFMENKDYTKGWVHLDDATRTDRPSRVFIP